MLCNSCGTRHAFETCESGQSPATLAKRNTLSMKAIVCCVAYLLTSIFRLPAGARNCYTHSMRYTTQEYVILKKVLFELLISLYGISEITQTLNYKHIDDLPFLFLKHTVNAPSESVLYKILIPSQRTLVVCTFVFVVRFTCGLWMIWLDGGLR